MTDKIEEGTLIVCSAIKRPIICQNCEAEIGKIYEDGWGFEPCKVDSFHQSIDKDTVLNTLLCPKCGCMIQIKR